MVSDSKKQLTDAFPKKADNIRAPELVGTKCTKCGFCIEVCPQNVFNHWKGRYIVEQPEKCIECGACVLNCRGDAISFEPFPGCGCIWNATFRRLKNITSWRKATVQSTNSCGSTD
jgi:ferredoxin